MQTHGGQKFRQELLSSLPPNAFKLRECRCNDDKLSNNAVVVVVVVDVYVFLRKNNNVIWERIQYLYVLHLHRWNRSSQTTLKGGDTKLSASPSIKRGKRSISITSDNLDLSLALLT